MPILDFRLPIETAASSCSGAPRPLHLDPDLERGPWTLDLRRLLWHSYAVRFANLSPQSTNQEVEEVMTTIRQDACRQAQVLQLSIGRALRTCCFFVCLILPLDSSFAQVAKIEPSQPKW